MMQYISLIAVAVALYGTYLNAQQKRSGFYFWLVTNAFFSAESFCAGLPAQGLLFLAYFVLAIKGLRTWKG